ncbi:hypothetical protein CON09_15925 [Bacillus anthracis]|nr:hypothetical protein CON09_15925 [Bacillus anthracis]
MFEKDNKDTFVKFNKEVYKKDSMDIFLYGVLKTFENKAGFTSISVKQLMEFSDSGRSLVYKIEQSLTNLIEQQLITVYDAIDMKNKVEINNSRQSDILYIRINEMLTDNDPFIQIYTNEILRFISKKMKGTKVEIFKQFIYILKFVNQGNGYRKISFPNIAKISEETGGSDRTVKNYTKILEEEGFLYSNILIMEKEKVKKIYSRPQYSQDVDDAIAECIAKNTKTINIKKGNAQSVETIVVQDSKKYKATMKKPELLLTLDRQIRDTFQKYEGESNDQALSKLQKYQEKHEVEVLVKALHIAMDGRIGLKNPTGFMLKQLADGDAIKEAEYRIKRSKELSERMDREDSVVKHFDYKEALREKKKKEQEGKGEVNNQRGNERKFYPELVEAQKSESKEQRQNQVELLPYIPEWKREGFNSRENHEKVKEEKGMRKLLASLYIS